VIAVGLEMTGDEHFRLRQHLEHCGHEGVHSHGHHGLQLAIILLRNLLLSQINLHSVLQAIALQNKEGVLLVTLPDGLL